ncbi:MAG TPA: glycosyltransferase family 4 protein [Candidatus Angelobacter sp.]
MRILITTDTVGGVWTYTRELVSGLVDRGFEVVLVSFGGVPSAEQTRWMDGLPNLDYRPTAFKLEWMQDSMDDLRASQEYMEAVAEETRPNLLHLNQFYYGAMKYNAPRLVAAHSDVVSWWVAVHGCEPPDSSWMRWYRRIVTHGVTSATAVVAPSHWMMEQVGRYYAQGTLTAVIHNGRTPSLFCSGPTKERMITTVGRLWDTGKNAALLTQEEMPWPVCIVGPGKQPGREETSTEQQGRRPGIQFLPQQSEEQLCELLSRTAVYAAVSRYEPFGLAPVEAAFSGCAIVASQIEPFRELWGNAALFFRNNDAGSLRQALTDLAEDPEFRHAFAKRAYDHARRWFTADRMVQQYASFYRTLAREKTVLHQEHAAALAGTQHTGG